MITISKEQVSEEEFETVVQSRGFQKMLLYQRLADGIEVLQTHDLLYDSMVTAITERHSEIESDEVTREVLEHLEREVATYTDPLAASEAAGSQRSQEEDMPLTEATTTDTTGKTETKPEKTVQKYIEDCLRESDELEVQANDIASAVGLKSTHVGTILGRWRHADDAPFTISATEAAGTGNTWTITRAGTAE